MGEVPEEAVEVIGEAAGLLKHPGLLGMFGDLGEVDLARRQTYGEQDR